eukprot:1141149-Pelagomonas_calceolata.AAC.5
MQTWENRNPCVSPNASFDKQARLRGSPCKSGKLRAPWSGEASNRRTLTIWVICLSSRAGQASSFAYGRLQQRLRLCREGLPASMNAGPARCVCPSRRRTPANKHGEVASPPSMNTGLVRCVRPNRRKPPTNGHAPRSSPSSPNSHTSCHPPPLKLLLSNRHSAVGMSSLQSAPCLILNLFNPVQTDTALSVVSNAASTTLDWLQWHHPEKCRHSVLFQDGHTPSKAMCSKGAVHTLAFHNTQITRVQLMQQAQAQQGHAQQAHLAQQQKQQQQQGGGAAAQLSQPPGRPASSSSPSGQPVFVAPSDQPPLTSPLELAQLTALLENLLGQPDQSKVELLLDRLAEEVRCMPCCRRVILV